MRLASSFFINQRYTNVPLILPLPLSVHIPGASGIEPSKGVGILMSGYKVKMKASQADWDQLGAVMVLQAWWRGEQERSRVRRLIKSLAKRRYLVQELVETQERYIRDLSLVVSDFKGRLLQRKVITHAQSVRLFSNLDQIRQLNELFFATIITHVDAYSNYQVIFGEAEKEIPFFKIYFEYFNNYPASNRLVDELTEHNEGFAQFFRSARANPKYHGLTLKDYLIKPVQRLPKYVLIMREIRKLTPCGHPDLANVEQVLRSFEQVNNSNNDKLNQVLNSYKISEIERSLLLPHTISEPGVEFIGEEPVTLLAMDGQVVEGTLYLLSTEVIVARRYERGQFEKGEGRVLSCVPFRHGGEIMCNEEHFYYRNSFTIQNGEGDSCTLVFESEEEKESLLQKVYHQLMRTEQHNLEKLASLCHLDSPASVQYLRKMNRLDLLPEVEVLGTEERNDSMFKYTIYILEVKIKTIRQKLFLRFSELLELQALAQGQGLTIKNELVKTTWLLNHKPRKIEERKMNIQRFLKELLSKQEVVEDGQAILDALGLPSMFYRLPEYFRQGEEVMKRSCLSQRSTNSQEEPLPKPPLSKHRASRRSSLFNSIPELMVDPLRHSALPRQVSIQDILQANELNLGHFTRLSEALYRISEQERKVEFDVLIPWLENERGFVRQRVRIALSQKVYFLIEKVSSQISLKYYKDFRLYLERDYAQRLLDDDECLSKIADEIRFGKYLLILKKMVYLTPEMEEREVRDDRVRLQIVASQAVYDCKKDKYLLSYSTILKVSALVGLAQLFREISPHLLPHQLDLGDVRERQLGSRTRELVANSFTSFYDSPATWNGDYEKMIGSLYLKLREICLQNSIAFRHSGVKDTEKEYNTTSLAQLASISVINELKENPFYGSVQFIVQISEDFRQILRAVQQAEGNEGQEEGFENHNCWLIIKYSGLHLYSISLRSQLFTIHYEDVLKMVAYPASVELRLRGRQVDSLKLKTTYSYSIRELLVYYKQYNEMIHKMEEDGRFEESVLEFVREYQTSTVEGGILGILGSSCRRTLVQ